MPIPRTFAALAGLALGAVLAGPTSAPTTIPTVRTQAIELVDAAGTVRASLTVAPDGEAVFRMRDAKGTIRVKLGASEEGSGLLLLDGATDPSVHILARRSETTFTVKDPTGRLRALWP